MAEPQAPQQKNEGDVPDLSGTMVGRFAIRSRLGVGGMGEVYRADDTRLKRPVALKRIAPQLRADEDYRSYFVKEAERASALIDPHIASVYDVLEENGETFLVMEYVEGQTLRQRLKQPLNLKEFLPLVVQCAEALVAAHEKGIVHRDIKPENLMVTPKGQLKILDFGVAKRVPRTDETTAAATTASTAAPFAGTPAYMAPEALLDKKIDGRADIFSLGVILYEVLAGRHPFRADTFTATSDRILHAVPAPLAKLNPEVPAELERIVAKMLAKDPAERHATARDLLVDLRAVQRAILYPPLQVTFPPQRAKRRRALIAAGLAVVALVLLSVGLWNFFRLAPPTERIRIAVLPFANQTGDERLEEFRLTLTQILTHDLTESPNIRVLPYEGLLDITRGFETQGKDISSPEVIEALANYSDSQVVVVPTMFAVGSTARVQVEFRDAIAGETVGGTKVERVLSGSAEETFYSMLGELAEGIQQHFKDMGRGEDYRPLPEGSRPKTVAAALHLTEGRNAAAQGNYAQALNSFQLAVNKEPGFALAYAWVGQIYGLLGYDDKARDFSEQAAQLIIAQTPITDAYFIEANLAERKYDYSAAEEKYLQLIQLYSDEPIWHASLAAVYAKQGQYPKAIASYQEALFRDSTYIVAYERLAPLYSTTGDLEQALSHAQKALNLCRAVSNREGEASALVDLGDIFRRRGEYQQAREYGQSALKLFKELGNEFGVLRATRHLGNIRFHEGNLKEARRYYQQVISASGEIRNNRLVVLTLMNMGVTYLFEGDLVKAVEYYERSLAQERVYGEYRDWPALEGRASALTNLGGIYIEYGPNPKRGLQLVEEALAIFRMMGDTGWEAQGRMLLGFYHMNAGRYELAMDHLQASRSLFGTVGDKRGMAQSAYTTGRCYFIQNKYEQALTSLEDALALFQDLQDRFGVANSQTLLRWTHHRLGDSARGRTLLEEALRVVQENDFGELLPDAYNALGEVYRESGEKQRARRSFEQASALWKGSSVSDFSIEARSNLGLLEAERGNFERALSSCQESVAHARRLERVHTLALTLTNLAGVHLLQKDYAGAIEALDEVSSLAEGNLGLELRAKAYAVRSKALEALGRTEEAKASYRQGEEAIRKLQQALAPGHRESFAQRSDIRALLR